VSEPTKTMNHSATTDPDAFVNPHSLANRVGRLAWSIVFNTLYRWTPPRLGMPWRRLLLRSFGAKLGRAYLHPSTRIWAPWLLSAGDQVYVDRNCNLYNAFGCELHDRVIISFGTVLCSASHDFTQSTYPLCGERIVVESDSWIAAECFICPGVRFGAGSVAGARSVLTKNVPAGMVIAGNPARVLRPRWPSENH
jgi:putative colanic acid biosynthesis acetyltransferase WcaF